jgi:Flp pilus assembly protein TadD
VTRAAPADIAHLVPEHVSAPVAPIASALEPAPAPPPQPPAAAARGRRTSYRALAFGAVAAIGAALVAIVATQPVMHGAGQPEPAPQAPAAELEPSSKVAQRPQTRAELAPATTPRELAAAPSEHGKLRATTIPRGSEAAELLQRAKQARDASRHKESEALLSELLARYPDDFGARYHMALTLVRLRRFAEAHAQLAKALELNNESASAWLLKGDIFLQEGRRREALRAWNRCLELQADLPTCHERLARWRMR